MNRRIWESLRYSSTLPVRGALAIAAAIFAVLFVFAPEHLAGDAVYIFLFALAPSRAWAATFAINALLLAWRIFERQPRIGWSRLINAGTCGLWAVYLVVLYKARGFFAPDCAADLALFLAAIWCALRTDLNVNDRESA